MQNAEMRKCEAFDVVNADCYMSLRAIQHLVFIIQHSALCF